MARIIPVSQLQTHPDNPPGRLVVDADLAMSIRGCGILQPLIVEHHPAMPDVFLVIDGHRRLAAAGRVGLTEVPCEVRPPRTARIHNRDRLVINGHRQDMNPMDQARGFKAMLHEGMTVSDVARVTGYTASHISARLQLLKLDDATQQRVESRALPADVALEAVRVATGTKRRSARGKSSKPLHFGNAHPLAGPAADRCRGQHPTGTGRVGGVACGPCWEQTIRDDAIARQHNEEVA